jgi:hypothetical protein
MWTRVAHPAPPSHSSVWYVRPVSDPPRLPEEFAPTGAKLSRFRIAPAPPLRPGLFPDEARFAFRLSVLAGSAELAAWAWFAHAGGRAAVLGWAALRLLKPAWAFLGTRVPRPAVAFALLFLAVAGAAASLLTLGQLFTAGLLAAALPAVGDLCATCAGDSITVERRSAAFAWLDMAQGLGAALGLALGTAFGGAAMVAGGAALLLGSVGVPDLHDRGTPRSAWSLPAYERVFRSPFGVQMCAIAFFGAFLALQRPPERFPAWAALLLPLAGMAIAARLEPLLPNAVILPRAALVAAALGLIWPPLRLLAIGALFAAIPASVARGAGEMERPIASSLAWSALAAGAAVGAVL